MLLMCSAWFIGRDIIILSEDGEGYSIRTRYRPEGVVNPGPELLLGYIKNTHYQALVPMRTVLHDVVCGRCGKCARSLKSHLNCSPNCQSYYNIPELDQMMKTMRRCEGRLGHQVYNREYANRCWEMLQLQQKCNKLQRKSNELCNDVELRREAEKMQEKRRRVQSAYFRRNQERLRRRWRKYYINHREEIKMKALMRYRKNRDEILEKRRLQKRLRMILHQEKIRRKRRLQQERKRRRERNKL